MTQCLLVSLLLGAPAGAPLNVEVELLDNRQGISYSIENNSKNDVIFSARWDYFQVLGVLNGKQRCLSTFYPGADMSKLGVRSMITLKPMAKLLGQERFQTAPVRGERIMLVLRPVHKGELYRIESLEQGFLLTKELKSNVLVF